MHACMYVCMHESRMNGWKDGSILARKEGRKEGTKGGWKDR